MKRPENRPSPSPRYAAHDIDYALASERWARGLSEMTLRSLTSDYLTTPEQSRTDDMCDAHTEFLRREEAGLLRDDKSQELTLRARKSRSGNRSMK